MTAQRPAAPAPSTQELEAFLQRFFGRGNDAWPDMDPDPGKGDRARPFVDLLRSGSDIPIVLPRYQQAQDRFAIYVIARDDAHATLVGNIITAFAGATYLSGVGVYPCTLDSNDPIEAAVQEFAGTATTTFRLETHPNRRFRQRLTDVALLMQHTLAHRPPRLWRAVKPTGRLLAEFDAALAAGGQAASQAVLDQLVGQGGITAANLAHLHIKRLTRLGLDRELLDYPGLGDVLRQDPPAPVKAAVLDAVFSCDVQKPLSRGDLPDAQQALHDRGFLALAPFENDMESYSADALVVLLLAAVTRGALHSSQRILTTIEHTGSRDVLPPVLREAATTLLGPQNAPQSNPALEAAGTPVESPKPPTPPSLLQDTDPAAVEPIPASWAALFNAIADGYTGLNAILEDEVWTAWPSPASDDRAVAALLEELHDESQRKVWRCVGAFIESVGYDQPAPLSARALITCALAYDWLGPGDLLAVQALTEIVLRSSPSAVVYGQLLGELADTCERWVAPERAAIALDFADRLILEACPDPDARDSLALALLLPLSVHQGRLDVADIAMARRLSLELGIELDWHEQPDEDLAQDTDASLQKAAGRNVLLYSLDQRVLDRVSEGLQQLAPGVKVACAHDSVGSPALRQKARQADVVVLATRCAKHAATGFITQHAKATVIDYADGSGSASLMRAAVHGLLRTVHGD
ncbi:protein DpdD [Streptomyces sp. NPDC093990]|uniref:protein DpdD n=1 Tax=Streptomyces sp. NPDC093990 TaxID=3155306 RepID=UPI0034245771